MRITPAVAAFAAAALAAGCVPPQPDNERQAIRNALPTAESVKIDVPEASYRTLGEVASFYQVTRNISRDLNAGAAWVLIVVHTIVQFPPTTVDGNVYTWGPWSDSLDPAEYRLVVTALDDGTYDWQLDGRNKTVAGAEFLAVISGNAVPGADPHHGSGSFFIDFDTAEEVNPIDNHARGTVEVVYDLENRDGTPGTVAMAIDTRDDFGQPVEFDYAYARNLDGSGDLVFGVKADFDDEGDLPEEALIRSRWQSNGEGRADIRLSSGDLGGLTVTGSECWDETFRRVYYADSADWLPAEGDEAACAFADQDLPGA